MQFSFFKKSKKAKGMFRTQEFHRNRVEISHESVQFYRKNTEIEFFPQSNSWIEEVPAKAIL
jgi:hypothetical protein